MGNNNHEYVDMYKECTHIKDLTISEDYCVYLRDDSMEGTIRRSIPQGSFCFVSRTAPIENGDGVAVLIDGRVFIRLYNDVDDKIIFTPNNRNYKAMTFEKNDFKSFCVLGRVMKFHARL